MKRLYVTLVAVAAMCLLASEVNAQLKVVWAEGYPKPGLNEGEFLIKGTAMPAGGFTLLEAASVHWWLVGSGAMNIKGFKINKMTGEFEETIATKFKGAHNWVLIQAQYLPEGQVLPVPIASDPAKSFTK